MKEDPRNKKAPQPVGAKKREDRPPSDIAMPAYAEMDLLDEQAIMAGMVGQELDEMLYDIPRKIDGGSTHCHDPKCKYNGREPHAHTQGLSVTGVNFLINRVMHGIDVAPVKSEIVDHHGRKYYRVTAIAVDQYTGARRIGIAEAAVEPPKKTYDPTGYYGEIIATNKAERNAAMKLMDTLVKGIPKLAKLGKKKFEESDVEALFSGLFRERKRLAERYFQSVIGGATAIPRNVTPRPLTHALPSTTPIEVIEENMGTPAPVGQTEPESEPEQQRETKKFAMTKSQRKYLTDLLHQNDIKDDALIGGFLKSIEDDAEQASQLIQAFTDKDFRAYEDWLFNRKPGACGGQEGLGLDK